MNKHEQYSAYESEVHGKAKISDRLREAERDQLARLAQGEQTNGISGMLKRLSNFFHWSSFNLDYHVKYPIWKTSVRDRFNSKNSRRHLERG